MFVIDSLHLLFVILTTWQTVFLIDLPKISISTQRSQTPFYEELVYFLEATTLHRNVIKKLEEYDFSETARYAFVHTM